MTAVQYADIPDSAVVKIVAGSSFPLDDLIVSFRSGRRVAHLICDACSDSDIFAAFCKSIRKPHRQDFRIALGAWASTTAERIGRLSTELKTARAALANIEAYL